MIFCSSCGTQINESEKFCSQCGAENLSAKETSSSANSNNTDYEVKEKSDFIKNHEYSSKQTTENKSPIQIILALVILGLGYLAYNKYIDTSRIDNALEGLKPASYKILESESFVFNDTKNIVDYLVEGELENGEPFRAYIQHSSDVEDKTGVQYTTGGFTSCSGNFYNERYDFCSEGDGY